MDENTNQTSPIGSTITRSDPWSQMWEVASPGYAGIVVFGPAPRARTWCIRYESDGQYERMNADGVRAELMGAYRLTEAQIRAAGLGRIIPKWWRS